MSFLRSVLNVVSPLAIVAATLSAGCTVPYKSVACKTDSDCPSIEKIGHDVYDGGDTAPPPAMCCSFVCVIPSSGCDTGLRVISDHSGSYDVSECAPSTIMCAPTN